MIYSKEKDELLVTLALAGNDAAYEELVIRYQNSVLSTALTVTKCYHLAEDSAQEAFITAWIKLNTLRERAKFGAWVCRIAKNSAKNNLFRFREYVGIDEIADVTDNIESVEDTAIRNYEKESLHNTINNLPEKIRKVINLYYFEGLSVAEISEKTMTPVGTVKYHLHTGRKLIRKDYGEVYDMKDATLVERVMKSVYELKLWRLKRNKEGFSKEYERVLLEVESLPESTDKNSALADVKLTGYWWLPGEKNDAMLESLNELAVAGKNEDVLYILLCKESAKVPSAERVKYILENQIPRIRSLGFKRCEGYLWFDIGVIYLKTCESVLGRQAFDKVKSLLSPSEKYYNSVAPQLWISETFTDVTRCACYVDELRRIDDKLVSFSQYSDQEFYSSMSLYTNFDDIFKNVWRGDYLVYSYKMKVGDVCIGSDNHSKHTFLSNNETVTTLCETFENCEHWYISNNEREGRDDKHIWYKDGVGIVRIEQYISGYYINITLREYDIKGGKGILPMAKGNKWVYTREDFNGMYENVMEITYSDDEKSFFVQRHKVIEPDYDENSWADMMKAMRIRYFVLENGYYELADVSHYIERAEALAVSEYEKSYTELAAIIMRNIHAANKNIFPDTKLSSVWNFFEYAPVYITEDGIDAYHAFDRCFELKGDTRSHIYTLCQNDLYGILSDNTGFIWNNEWLNEGEYYAKMFNHNHTKCYINTKYCGTVKTLCGEFENCLRVKLDSEGFEGGFAYRGGKREYYFAEGIGIVRVVVYYNNCKCKTVYELTEYSGETEAEYFPLGEGFVRKYKPVGIPENEIAESHYIYRRDEKGKFIILSARTGLKKRE